MLSRAGDVPLVPKRLSSIKPPTRCPHCNSIRLIKKGTRAKKLERVPLYHCRACGCTFSAGPLAIRNKTYPLPEILEALTLYNRGSTLENTAAKISSRYGHRVAASTISRWLSEHSTLASFRRLRARARRLFSPTRIIRAQKLYHRQVYEFAYHRAKLAFLRDRTLDDKRAAGVGSTSARNVSPNCDAFFKIQRSGLGQEDQFHIVRKNRPNRSWAITRMATQKNWAQLTLRPINFNIRCLITSTRTALALPFSLAPQLEIQTTYPPPSLPEAVHDEAEVHS
jgi:transposase-like protein